MANELVIHYPTGATLYALLFDATGQIWNGAAFAVPGSASWTNYDIAMSEVATATGIYRASMPAAAAGIYGWVVRKQAGGSPAVSDIAVGSGEIRWTGIAEETIPASANVTSWNGDAPADLDASGNVLAKLADGVVHGGWSSYLLLKSLDIRNTDAGGLGIYVLASDAILGGRAIQIDGTGLSKAIEINGIFDADLSGTIAGLTADAQQDVADAANNLAPALTGATGSIRAKLDAIKLVTDAIDSSAVTVTSTNNAGVLTFTQGVTFTATVSGLTISATWAKLYFTLKESDYDTDDMALIQIVENNPAAGTDGLLYLNSAALVLPIALTDGTLTVSQAGGTVAIAITDNAMAALSKASGLVWDIKTKDASGATVQNATGTASIGRAITQTI